MTQEFAKLKKKPLHMQAKSSIFETLAKAMRKFKRKMTCNLTGMVVIMRAIVKQVDIASVK